MCLCAIIIQASATCQLCLQCPDHGRQLHQSAGGDRASIRRDPTISECLGERDIAQHTAIADVGSPEGTEAPFEEYGQAVPS
jgi:hypothetical protein